MEIGCSEFIPFLAYIPKVSIYGLHTVLSFWMLEPNFMKLGMPILVVYFIRLSHQSVCLYVYMPDCLSKHIPMARRIVGGIDLCVVHAISNESGWLILPRISCFVFVTYLYILFTYMWIWMYFQGWKTQKSEGTASRNRRSTWCISRKVS